MNSLTLDELTKINADFTYFQPKLDKLVTFDNLVAEANFLNTLESSLPEADFLGHHFDLIIEGKVTQYHKALNTGRNIILEKANVPTELKAALNESFEDLKIYITQMINEGGSLVLGAPVGGLDAAPHTPKVSSGLWSVLKGIWDALTEGGSVIGIIQFLIDIIGIVGDFIFPGVGVVADVLNAIIYAIRGKWLLCAISLIAAFIIGFGDTLKMFKPVAKPAEEILVVLTKAGGAKTAAEMAAKQGAKGGQIMKLLSGIARFLPEVLGKAAAIISKFSDNIGKVLGKIPGLGRLLEPIFAGIGRVVKSFSDKMAMFSNNFKLMTKEGAEVAFKDINKGIAQGTVKMAPNGKSFTVMVDGVAKTFPTKFLTKNGFYKIYGGPALTEILFKGAKDFPTAYAKYLKALKSPAATKSFSRRFSEFLVKTKAAKRVAGINIKLVIGKAIYNFIFGEPWKEGGKWTKEEVEGHGNGALNDWIDRKISEEKNKTGATYVPSLILDGNNQEVYDRISDYQNHQANIMGKPNIIEAIRSKSSSDKTQAEFNEFFNAIEQGDIKNTGKGDVTKTDNYREVIKQNKPRMSESIVRTVSSFSDFKKG